MAEKGAHNLFTTLVKIGTSATMVMVSINNPIGVRHLLGFDICPGSVKCSIQGPFGSQYLQIEQPGLASQAIPIDENNQIYGQSINKYIDSITPASEKGPLQNPWLRTTALLLLSALTKEKRRKIGAQRETAQEPAWLDAVVKAPIFAYLASSGVGLTALGAVLDFVHLKLAQAALKSDNDPMSWREGIKSSRSGGYSYAGGSFDQAIGNVFAFDNERLREELAGDDKDRLLKQLHDVGVQFRAATISEANRLSRTPDYKDLPVGAAHAALEQTVKDYTSQLLALQSEVATGWGGDPEKGELIANLVSRMDSLLEKARAADEMEFTEKHITGKSK